MENVSGFLLLAWRGQRGWRQFDSGLTLAPLSGHRLVTTRQDLALVGAQCRTLDGIIAAHLGVCGGGAAAHRTLLLLFRRVGRSATYFTALWRYLSVNTSDLPSPTHRSIFIRLGFHVLIDLALSIRDDVDDKHWTGTLTNNLRRLEHFPGTDENFYPATENRNCQRGKLGD